MAENAEELRLETGQIAVVESVLRTFSGRLEVSVPLRMVFFPGEEDSISDLPVVTEASPGTTHAHRVQVLEPGESCVVGDHGWILTYKERVTNKDGDAVRKRIVPAPLRWLLKERTETAPPMPYPES